MAEERGNRPNRDSKKRVMLLINARSYRSKAFRSAAERLDIEVVAAIDMDKELAEYWDYPLGINFADSGKSVEAIVNYAQENPITAIIAVDDSGLDIVAEASQILGLPFNSPEAAKAARNKWEMRRKLKESELNTPQFIGKHFPGGLDAKELLKELAAEAESISYPCVLKPLSLSGSRGVIRADSPDEFVNAAVELWKLLSKIDPSPSPKEYLVEDYIPGFEVALEGILDNGNLKVLALFDKPDPLRGPYFEETLYVTPSRLEPGVQKEIAKCAAEAARILGLVVGPVHAELRINEFGPWLIEIANRSIGGLCSDSLRFGVDMPLEEVILRQAIGLDIATIQREARASGVLMIPIPERGILKAVNGCETAEAVPLIESLEITARLNYPLVPLPEGDSYLGFIFARGTNPNDVESALREAHGKLSFNILPELKIAPGHGQLNFQTRNLPPNWANR